MEVLDKLAVEGGDRGGQSVSLISQVCGGAPLEVGDRRGREASTIPRLRLASLLTKFAKDSDEDVNQEAWRGVTALARDLRAAIPIHAGGRSMGVPQGPQGVLKRRTARARDVAPASALVFCFPGARR